jgi:hypothetical protein
MKNRLVVFLVFAGIIGMSAVVSANAAEPAKKPVVATPAVTKSDAGKPAAEKKPVPKPTKNPVEEKKKRDAELAKKCSANPKDPSCKKKPSKGK